jgi:hypothetical protein
MKCVYTAGADEYILGLLLQRKTRMVTGRRYARSSTLDGYAEGIASEVKIFEFLRDCGDFKTVEYVKDKERQLQDIDVMLDGVPTSIKTQHAGAVYGNLCIELATEHYGFGFQPGDKEKCLAMVEKCGGYIPESKIALLNPGWWFMSEAKQMVILQGDVLKLWDKQVLQNYIDWNGFLRVRSLSPKVLAGQKWLNTWSGYLPNTIPCSKQWVMPA